MQQLVSGGMSFSGDKARRLLGGVSWWGVRHLRQGQGSLGGGHEGTLSHTGGHSCEEGQGCQHVALLMHVTKPRSPYRLWVCPMQRGPRSPVLSVMFVVILALQHTMMCSLSAQQPVVHVQIVRAMATWAMPPPCPVLSVNYSRGIANLPPCFLATCYPVPYPCHTHVTCHIPATPCMPHTYHLSPCGCGRQAWPQVGTSQG